MVGARGPPTPTTPYWAASDLFFQCWQAVTSDAIVYYFRKTGVFSPYLSISYKGVVDSKMTPGKARFAAVVFVWIAVEAGACDDHIFSEGFEPIDLLFNAQVYVDQYAGNVAVVWERTPGPVHISLWNISDDCEQASATQIGGYNLGFGQFHFSGDEGDTFEFRLIPNGNSVRFTYGAVNVALLTIDE